MTFIYELDLYSLELYRMCEYELPKAKLSKVIVSWTIDIQTDRHDLIYHAASRMVNNNDDD